MKILVTGGRGFLGGYIARRLAPHHELVVTDLDDLDVRDRAALVRRMEAVAPHAVLHLAALCGAIPSRRDPAAFLETNLTGTLQVLEACRLTGVGRLCFTSSLTVFGQCAQTPVTEESPYAPRHPYACSKAAAELAIRTYTDHCGLQALILRPTLVVGEGCVEKHAIGDFLSTALNRQSIDIFGDGGHVRDFIHPDDVAEAVAAAFDLWERPTAPACESFNFSSGEAMTMAELARLILRETDTPEASHLRFVAPTAQTFSLYTSNKKAERVLGWRPRVRIQDIVERLRGQWGLTP